MLDAPLEATRSPLLLREVGWGFLAASRDSALGTSLANESPQGVRFAIQAVDYLCKAGDLPPEFNRDIGDRLLALAPLT